MALFYESSYQRVLSHSLALCALFLPVSPVLYAETGTAVDFRVSGIMRVGKELYRGLVESPDGNKRIVREGDTIEQWKVTRINGQCLILSKETQTHEECLSGTGVTESLEATKESISAKKTENQTAVANTASKSHFKQVDKVELLQTLDSLALNGRDLTMDNISDAILPLTDLPVTSHIAEVNAQVPESAQDALNQIRQQADKNGPIRLTVTNEADPQPGRSAGSKSVIYLQTSVHPPIKKQ